MNIDLTPFVVLGALLVLSVIAMMIWRKLVAREEDDTLHVLGAGPAIARQASVANKLDLIDKWGQTVTIIAVIYVVILGSLFAYQQWIRATNLGV